MMHDPNGAKPTVRVEASEETLASWIGSPEVSDELRTMLGSVDVLVVPFIGYVDRPNLRYFPEGTDELLEILRTVLRPDVRVDICAADEDYQELDLHSDELRVAKIVFDYVLWPIVTSAISAWIDRLRAKRRKNLRVRSKFVLTKTPAGSSLEVSYDGPAAEYRDVMQKALAAVAEISPEEGRPGSGRE